MNQIKQLVIDYELYLSDISKAERSGFREGVRACLLAIGVIKDGYNDCFEVFDCDAYEDHQVKLLVCKLNELKGFVKNDKVEDGDD